MSENIENQPLLPELITPDQEAYKIVEELKEVLDLSFEKKGIRNIALTGPFGSGKSSIIKTLLSLLPKERKSLHISLATLRVDDRITEKEKIIPLNSVEKEAAEEALNRKIEYSILQQLIYHEKGLDVPSSRLKRIFHIPSKRLWIKSIAVVVFILSFFIAFEPSWGRIDTLYSFFNLGDLNKWIDLIAVLYMLSCIAISIKNAIPVYANSRFNKLNLKDASIEITEETSVFNRHLDEILYFFQATNYDIVILEDLDRFGTSKIFLKLRELNFLLNESNAIERHIVFLYAVKDDLFKDEERTKFFDYITTVIPVINPSNSKAVLKNALSERGIPEKEISDDDLSEIAFFIQDMRILKNIANEYVQYRKLLFKNKHLDYAKLLAMIVYKNYHPQDFAMLHRREGQIYACFSKKSVFIEVALQALEEKKKELVNLKQQVQENLHLKEKDLRTLLLVTLREELHDKFYRVKVNGEYRTLKEVANNSSLFDELLGLSNVEYQYLNSNYYGNPQNGSKAIDFDAIKRRLNFGSRLKAIRTTPQSLIEREQSIHQEEQKIRGYTFKDLFSVFDMQDREEYTSIGLSPMMDVFIRRGYINEDYYDYISYFYEGMITQNDYDLLLSIKRRIIQPADTPIDKIENFHKELRPYMFRDKAILNNDLLDYVVLNSTDSFERIMRVIGANKELNFLAQYYVLGNAQPEVFKHFIARGKKKSWNAILNHKKDEEKNQLLEAWLRFSDDIIAPPEDWLNGNFNFIESHYEGIGEERSISLCTEALFDEISSTNKTLIDCVIDNNSYKITTHNIGIIVSYLLNRSIEESALNYSLCLSTENSNFISYINENLEETLNTFSHSNKKEDAVGITVLLNSEQITENMKETYLTDQENRLSDYSELEEDVKGLATRLLLIDPTWDNVSEYFQLTNKMSSELVLFIEHFSSELSESTTLRKEEMQPLFESLSKCSKINNETISQLLPAFKENILIGAVLEEISQSRIVILLRAGKIPFVEDNTEILKETSIFGEYLLFYPEETVEHLSSDFFTSADVSEEILTSNKFTFSQKAEIIKNVPTEHLYNTMAIANVAIEVIVAQEISIIDDETLIGIIEQSNKNNKCIVLVTRMIEESSEVNKISELLKILGGVYTEIANRETHPKIAKSVINRNLLSVLEDKGFISSFKEDKNGESYRVFPPRK